MHGREPMAGPLKRTRFAAPPLIKAFHPTPSKAIGVHFQDPGHLFQVPCPGRLRPCGYQGPETVEQDCTELRGLQPPEDTLLAMGVPLSEALERDETSRGGSAVVVRRAKVLRRPRTRTETTPSLGSSRSKSTLTTRPPGRFPIRNRTVDERPKSWIGKRPASKRTVLPGPG